MRATDANGKLIEWLKGNEMLQKKLYFIFGEAMNDSVTFTPIPEKPYENRDVLGNETCYATIRVDAYKTYDTDRITEDGTTKNMDDVACMQDIVDWIMEQNDTRNFPDIGDGAVVESITVISAQPHVQPISKEKRLALYVMAIRMEYTVFME